MSNPDHGSRFTSMQSYRRRQESLDSSCDSAGSRDSAPIPLEEHPLVTPPTYPKLHQPSSIQKAQSLLETCELTPNQTKSVAGVQVASIFSEPSVYLQQILRSKTSSERILPQPLYPRKRARSRDSLEKPVIRRDDLIHRACCLSDVPLEQVQQLLASDPLAPQRPLILSTATAKPHIDTGFIIAFKASSGTTEPYAYPINLAIYHQARPEILLALIDAAPSVLCLPDGPRQETSLHILLRYTPQEASTVFEMLIRQPILVSLMDQQGNSPLHIASQFGASRESIQYLCLLSPETCRARNRLGQTPRELWMQARRTGDFPAAA